MSTPYSYIIAEDEPLLARVLAQQLNEHWPSARLAGVASNGAEALKLADEFSPDVVLADHSFANRCPRGSAATQPTLPSHPRSVGRPCWPIPARIPVRAVVRMRLVTT